MDLGFETAGFRSRLAIDADPAAVATFRRNHPGVRVEQHDLSKTSADTILRLWNEVSHEPPVGVIGGPPCQAFSKGNVHLKPGDIRRALPLHYAQILASLNRRFHLRFFAFENVAGLQTARHRADYEQFMQQFRQAGFRLFDAILDAQHFGVPQRRPRLFVVGVNEASYPSETFRFPLPPLLFTPRTVRDAIGGLPEPTFFRRGLLSEDIQFHPNHWTLKPRSWKFGDPEHGIKSSRGRSFRRLSWDAPSWTVAYGNREVHIHPGGHRRLSVYEAMLLQGFPESYCLEGTLSAQITQVSDAVPPPLAAALAAGIGAFLAGQEPGLLATSVDTLVRSASQPIVAQAAEGEAIAARPPAEYSAGKRSR